MSGTYDPEGDGISYRLKWGDGTQAEASTGSHSYEGAGQYTVTGTATDSSGATGIHSVQVQVCEIYSQGTCVGSQVVPDYCQTLPCEADPGDPCESQATCDDIDEAGADARDASPTGFGTPNVASSLCPGGTQEPATGDCLYVRHMMVNNQPPIEAAVSSADSCRDQDNRNKYKVVYAFIGEGNNHLDQLRNGSTLRADIRTALAGADRMVNASASLNGAGSRHLRFACNDNGITVQAVPLSRHAKVDDTDPGTDAVAEAMDDFKATNLYKRNSGTRRFILFPDWDDPTSNDTSCQAGGGEVSRSDSTPGRTNVNNTTAGRIALVYLAAGWCGEHLASSTLHEVGHTLGAVLAGAPHELNGHASDLYDAIEPGSGGSTVGACSDTKFKNRWDCRGDDYFNTSPSRGSWLADLNEFQNSKCGARTDPDIGCHWNVAWSKWLIR
jgi:hypothetical protein